MPTRPDLPSRFAAHWDQQGWLVPGARLAVAVSGGSDSVALLLLLRSISARRGLRLGVAHFHHGLRLEADSDAAFAGELAARLGLPFWLCRSQRLAPGMPNLEAAARRLRYRFFRRLTTGAPPLAAAVATGHTQNDQAETVLLRLLRGSGTLGLCGIWPVVAAGPGRILRPLLPFTRAELQAWLRSQGQPWREDATNRDPRHCRNRVRHQLLPLLERDYNPAIQRRLATLAEVLRGEEEYQARQATQDVAGSFETAAPEGVGMQAGAPGAQRRALRWEAGAPGAQRPALGREARRLTPRRAPTAALAALPVGRLRRLLRSLAAESGWPPPDFAHVEAVATAIRAAAGPSPPSRPRQFRLGRIVFRITSRWVWAAPGGPPASVILKP